MNKLKFPTLIASIVAMFSVPNVIAELKTSSLNMTKAQTNHLASTTLPEQCQKLFQEGEKLILEAEKQPGTHTQVKKMKDKLQFSKQTISTMDIAMQQKSCDKGLIALNNLKKKY
ncbi:MAG: DUF5339 domain-containing protein [Pasteurellaceae bacterium]|nr:DUF5339 domain-containing protein [Pasteurellaceae bacterium]